MAGPPNNPDFAAGQNTEDPKQVPLWSALASSWALMLGVALLMLGDGLQATLIGVRATMEAFSTTATGLMMSAFYVGFLGGSLYAPRIVARVGHIRVFGALASLASAAVLIHGVFVGPLVWAFLRLVSGLCFAGLYIVAESWLNERATNETRGKLLSVYMLVTYASVAIGQLLMNVAHPLGYELFILTSVLISIALVPLLLSAGSAPRHEESTSLSIRDLYRISPLGVIGVAGAGMSSAILFSMGPVFAGNIGLSVKDISILMTVTVLGCIVLQWPVGQMSDRLDRRRVITGVTCVAGFAVALAVPVIDNTQSLLLVMGLFGGMSLPMYSLLIAHANDQLEPEQMVAASSALVLASGIGAIAGPLFASVLMGEFGDAGFLWSLAVIHALIGVFAVYRMLRRPAKPLSEQGDYYPVTTRASQVAVDWAHSPSGDDPDSEK